MAGFRYALEKQPPVLVRGRTTSRRASRRACHRRRDRPKELVGVCEVDQLPPKVDDKDELRHVRL